MKQHILVGLSVALIASGCAAAVPGYVPPSERGDRYRALAPKGGGFETDGTYRLTEQEQQLDCKSLTGSMTIKILQMRDAATRTQPTALAATAQTVTRPVVGGTTYGADTSDDLRRDRARLETMNRRLSEKNCRTFDLDAELRPGNAAVPKPVGEQPRKRK